jgi:hypothetical protein
MACGVPVLCTTSTGGDGFHRTSTQWPPHRARSPGPRSRAGACLVAHAS